MENVAFERRERRASPTGKPQEEPGVTSRRGEKMTVVGQPNSLILLIHYLFTTYVLLIYLFRKLCWFTTVRHNALRTLARHFRASAGLMTLQWCRRHRATILRWQNPLLVHVRATELSCCLLHGAAMPRHGARSAARCWCRCPCCPCHQSAEGGTRGVIGRPGRSAGLPSRGAVGAVGAPLG